MSAPRWNEDALTEMKRIIHFMDMLITGLGKGLNDVNRQNYDDFRDDMRAIIGVVSLLHEKTEDLLSLKNGKGGKRPFWYVIGEDILWYCLRVQRAEEKVKAEMRRNEWDVVITRLEVARRKCIEIQKKILEMIPREERSRLASEVNVNASAALEYLDLVETVKMVNPDSSGAARYRKQY